MGEKRSRRATPCSYVAAEWQRARTPHNEYIERIHKRVPFHSFITIIKYTQETIYSSGEQQMAECFQLRCYTQYTHKAAIIVQVPLLTRYLTPRNSTILPCECVFVVVIVVAAARSHCLHEKLIHLSFWQTGEQKQSSNSFVGYVSYRIEYVRGW